MSFPASFGSQLAAVMEALLKAVVAEVTALVEDGAVELRLELRDRDREIREKQRAIEQRDRDILELRAAVEELRAREEAAAEAASPGEERPERTESCGQVWTKEQGPEPVVKCEPMEEFTDPRRSLWPPPPTAARSYDESSTESTHKPAAYACGKTEDFPHLDPADLPLESLRQFYSQLPPFSLVPGLPRAQDGDAGHGQRCADAKRLNYGPGGGGGGGFRCDQCGKTFTVKWRLVSHQSVHTGAKPFSCAKCGARFSRRDSCVRHEKKACCKDGPLLFQER